MRPRQSPDASRRAPARQSAPRALPTSTSPSFPTSGGWGIALVAHESQLVDVPDDLTDEQAVLIEPTACAVHAARTITSGEAAVIGAGTLGLLTIAAIRHLDELAG